MSAVQPAHSPDRASAPSERKTTSQDFEDFIYLLSHDVRNSVRALVEVPQWIEEDLMDAGHNMDGPIGQNIRLMHTHTRRLDRMLADLLVYSRVGRKQTVEIVALDRVLEAVLDQISVPAGMRITCDFQVPSVQIGKRDILTLVSALLSNAIRHHHTGQGLIRLSSRRVGPQVALSVRDDGPGIAQRYRARAMEAMTTLRPRDEVEGSGMGLAIARKIAHLYGGQIDIVDDSDCTGTHVRCTLPFPDQLG